jgi:Mg-chelatase subunit ChlD
MRLLTPWALVGLLPALAVLVASLRRRALLGRALTLAIISVALAGPEVAVRQAQETVLFLVDRSVSVGEEAQAALDYLLPEATTRGAEVGVIAFGETAQVSRWPGLGEIPSGGAFPALGTDIGGAVDLALALAPVGASQAVLLSDGRATSGDALAAASRARQQGVPVHVYPVGRADLVRLAELSGPREAPLGTIVLDATLEATRPVSATVTLSRGGSELQVRTLDLSPGRTRLSLADQPPGEGFWTYRVEVQAGGDPIPENNALFWGVAVGERWEVVVVGPRPTATDGLLAAANLSYRRLATLRPADLAGARLVILDDHPLGLVGSRTLDALRSYVAGGGGLLVIQGRHAVTGYLGPVEELLPVTYTVPERIQQATASVVFVLDRSGSMAARAGGTTKIEILKESAAAAVEAMPWEDVVGAVAFDRHPRWIVAPGPVSEVRDRLFAGLRGLTADGGTYLFPALEEAVEALLPVGTRVRHVMIISDGKTVRDEERLAWLREEITAAGIGVSAIAVGADADLEVLHELAELSGGRTYTLASMTDLRPVLVQETERVARRRFMEGETAVVPGPGAAAFPLSGDLPPLHGYTLTFPKPMADVAFMSPAGDPLLAAWRLGLGQVAVLNADLAGNWTRDWLASPQLGELWGILLGRLWAERQDVRVDWEVERQSIRVGLDAIEGGRWVNGLEFAGELVGPGEPETVTFQQVGPGRYEASLPLTEAGAYLLTVSEPTGRHGGSFPIVLPYPAELAAFGPDLDALQAISRLAGGTVLTDEVIPPAPGGGRDWLPIGRALLWAAAAAFVLDLALRKLLV